MSATYRHHACIANSILGLVEADERHSDHAVIEQVIAEFKDGPLAHLPSGKYAANAAWVAHAVIASNIARAAGSQDTSPARWETLRSRIINVPARIASTDRRLMLHLPIRWPWASNWESLWSTATGPPPTVATSPPSRRRRNRGPKWKSRPRPADQPRPGHRVHTRAPESPTPNHPRWIRAQPAS